MQGQPWASGTWTPDDLDLQVVEDASSYQGGWAPWQGILIPGGAAGLAAYDSPWARRDPQMPCRPRLLAAAPFTAVRTSVLHVLASMCLGSAAPADDMEGIESQEDAFFCRKIVGGAVEGTEVAYTGLRLVDSEDVQWALLFFNDTKQFWLFPYDALDYCNGQHPGCTAGVSGGRTEEGVTCELDTDCCGGLFCKPREVSEVRVVYDNLQGDVKYQPFRLAQPPGSSDPAVMPNECIRLHNGTLPGPGNGPRFDSPTFKEVPLDFCRSFGINCGGPAADYFCQLHGYGRAVEWSEPRGSACSTAFFPHCDTFQYIVCGNWRLQLLRPLPASIPHGQEVHWRQLGPPWA
ncbi:hypothetical protein ABPG75_005766 [Micractinium tetrahymenae]